MDLSGPQREILATLIDGHDAAGGPVTADDIAAELDRHPGTIHNHMQVLRTLGLVEGITGPRGGYEPTPAAVETMSGDGADGDAVTVAHGHERLSLTVESIRFTAVQNPTVCRAVVRFREPVSGVDVGDAVVAGPTPATGLVLAGEVCLFDDAENELLLDVSVAEAPVEE